MVPRLGCEGRGACQIYESKLKGRGDEHDQPLAQGGIVPRRKDRPVCSFFAPCVVPQRIEKHQTSAELELEDEDQVGGGDVEACSCAGRGGICSFSHAPAFAAQIDVMLEQLGGC